MTIEKRLVLAPSDVQAITIQCSKCESRFVANYVKRALSTPNNCPQCNEEWRVWTHPKDDLVYQLATVLKQLQQAEEHGGPYRVYLEMEAPKND